MPQDNPSVGRRVFSRTIAKTLCLHRIFISRVVGSALIVLSLLAVMLFGAFSGFARPQTAIAQAPNTTLNFQARILNLNGSLVPDGDYHIEFKIYDTVSSGGTAQGACSGNCLCCYKVAPCSKVRPCRDLYDVVGFKYAFTKY